MQPAHATPTSDYGSVQKGMQYRINPKRYLNYVVTESSTVCTISTFAATTAGVGAGGYVGFKGGTAATPFIAASPLAPIAPGIMPVSTAIGGLAGGLAVFTGSEKYMNHSKHYRKWKCLHIQDNVRSLFLQGAQSDNVLANYLDPLTGQLPVIPVQAPDGLIYEEQAIKALANRRGNIAAQADETGQYPVSAFNTRQLSRAHKCELAIQSRYIKLLERDLATPAVSDTAKDAITGYLNVVRDNKADCRIKCNQIIYQKYQGDEFLNQLNLLTTIEKADSVIDLNDRMWP